MYDSKAVHEALKKTGGVASSNYKYGDVKLMMKIAIWGYGRYGRRMFESLTCFCSDDYEVIRVYDTAYQKLKNTGGKKVLQIQNPEELLDDYKNGLFEKVLVSIFNDPQKPKQFLKEHSIPELRLGHPEDLYPLSSFKQGKKPFEIRNAGYDFYVLNNIHGALSNFERFEMLYLFDDTGKVIQEHADRFDLNLDNTGFYDYPFVFRHSKANKIFLEGQYCILAKMRSGINYWHFTYNNLDVAWLLEKSGFRGKYVVPNAKFCSELLQMLDISPDRIITLEAFEYNTIYVFEEVFYIALKGPYEIYNIPVLLEAYSTPVLLEAAEYIKKNLPVDRSLPKKIYIKRIGRRKLLGADDIIAEYGFTTIIPEEYSVQEQIKLFYNADIVFCVHGANSTNCLYMRKGTVFIEAFSSYWMNRFNLYSIAASKINYLPVSPLETVLKNNHMEGISKDFEIPEVLLRMTIQNAFLIYQAQQEAELLNPPDDS